MLSSLQTYIHRERREPTLRTWLFSDLWTVFKLSNKDTVYYQSQRLERGKTTEWLELYEGEGIAL